MKNKLYHKIKRIGFLLFSAFILLLKTGYSQQTQGQELILAGELKDLKKGDVFLLVIYDDKKGETIQIDTLRIEEDRRFNMVLTGRESSRALLVYYPAGEEIDRHPEDFWEHQHKELFISSGKLYITGNVQNLALIDIEGGIYQDDIRKYVREKDSLNQILWLQTRNWQCNEPTETERKNYNQQQARIQNKNLKRVMDLVNKRPDSEYAAFEYYDILDMVSNRIFRQMKFPYYQSNEDIKKIYYLFTPEVQRSKYGRLIKEFFDKKMSLQEGKKAPVFTLKNLEGQLLSSSAFRGKYVLLEFWDSYCEGCLQAMPHILDLHKKYAAKGLSIIGISLDKEVELCRQTLKQHLCPWLQVCIGQWKENREIADQYQVGGLPTFVLIDNRGKIALYNTTWPEIGRWLDQHIK